MKITEIRGLSETELVAKKRESRQEAFNLRLQQQSGQLEKPSRLNDLRKTVAKIETVLSEKRKNLTVKSRSPQKKA
jgi:large subunit ribosomal protein L29